MKEIIFKYGKKDISLNVPEDSIVYETKYPYQPSSPAEMLAETSQNSIGCEPLDQLLQKRKPGKVVIVVSDITRPIPYYSFLPQLIGYINEAGVPKDDIQILIATGMHRPSTLQERQEMFGMEIVNTIQIIDHEAENENELVALEGKSWSGSSVKLNKHYVNAGFRIVTGLVEPHFMAGFSGGRKAICPGLVSLDAIQKFHGYEFLSNENSSNTILENNPCHQENISIAKLCPAEFSLHVILDQKKKMNAVFSGELFISHEKAVDYVKNACCPKVEEQADLVITSCGGYPLDTTFYQCVKGMVSCLPSIKKGAKIISFGSCTEGVGSKEYTDTMKRYSGRYQQFIEDIKDPKCFVKDQWQFQMHIRTLDKIGQDGLHFFTSGLKEYELDKLSVNGNSVPENEIQQKIQDLIDDYISQKNKISVIPDGPYCAPVS